jgi:hypothetical protein
MSLRLSTAPNCEFFGSPPTGLYGALLEAMSSPDLLTSVVQYGFVFPFLFLVGFGNPVLLEARKPFLPNLFLPAVRRKLAYLG